MSRTFAELRVSPACFEEIRAALAQAGYDHAILDETRLDLDGIALVRGPEDRWMSHDEIQAVVLNQSK